MKLVKSRLLIAAACLPAAALVALGGGAVTRAGVTQAGAAQATATHAKTNSSQHLAINCSAASAMCAEVADSDKVFGHYVGHDEPSTIFYSNTAGSGNHLRYNVTLPVEPSASNPNAVGKSYTFELAGADWLGMALCATQSFPEQVSTCPADSDKNVLDPTISPRHVGQAYMELQFYPPGWVPWPTWAVAVGASSCNPTMWCAAMNIFSLALNPVTGQSLNSTCLSKVGEEYVNFAFLTKNGKPQAPPNPVQSTLATFTPSTQDLYMNPGDHLSVSMTDTKGGLRTSINDLSTGQTGAMTASAANGFAQVQFAPTGTSCTLQPYSFHPMYSTSSPKTRVTWAAHSYNTAFVNEIGHFQFCNGPYRIPDTPFGIDSRGHVTQCPSGDTEGRGLNAGPPDSDDIFCFPGREALVFKVSGCTFTNSGFDGASYQELWPNGKTSNRPTPFQVSSPETGANYSVQYKQAAFEADLPLTESGCNTNTGADCTLIPQTDEGQPAVFYPYFSTVKTSTGCMWQFGADTPHKISDFGQNAQYGPLLQQSYTGKGGSTSESLLDFRNILPSNPCPQA